MTTPTGSSPLLEGMKRNGMALTVRNYLELNYPDGVPDTLTGEELAGLPDELALHDPEGMRALLA